MRWIICMLLFSFTACGQPVATKSTQQPLDAEQVALIEMNEEADGLTAYGLNPEQQADFIQRWNAAKIVGPVRYISRYRFTVTLKDGSTRTFRTNGRLFEEIGGHICYIEDETYFDRLWGEIGEQPFRDGPRE